MAEIDSWLDMLSEAVELIDSVEIGNKCKTPIRVPRIDYDSITAEEFFEKYSRTNTPIILGNAESHMPMHLTTAYWGKYHGNKIVPLDVNMPSQVSLCFEVES